MCSIFFAVRAPSLKFSNIVIALRKRGFERSRPEFDLLWGFYFAPLWGFYLLTIYQLGVCHEKIMKYQ